MLSSPLYEESKLGAFDVDRTYSDWFENQEPERAVHAAKQALTGLKRREEAPAIALVQLEGAIGAACDGPGGDARLAYEAALAYEGPFREAEVHGGLHTPEQIELRSRGQLVIARAGHRAGFEHDAFVRMLTLLRWLEKSLEEGAGLRAGLSSSAPNAGAAAAVRALGLYPAALRRGGYDATEVAHFAYLAYPYVESYVSAGGRDALPPLYDCTHALASQWLYLFLLLAPRDALVARLITLEAATRPNNARGRATEPLRDYALARHAGNLDELERLTAEAKARLEAFPLQRHLGVVERLGYLAA